MTVVVFFYNTGFCLAHAVNFEAFSDPPYYRFPHTLKEVQEKMTGERLPGFGQLLLRGNKLGATRSAGPFFVFSVPGGD